MGWLYQSDPIAHLTGKYNYEDDHHKQEVLDGARVGNTVYLAIRAAEKADNRTFVFAAVLMISNTRRHGFGYKEQDEFMGPNQCACPARIMCRLSPISDLPRISYAVEWRARVAEYNHQKRQRWLRRQSLRLGSIVSLPSPARFGMGVTASRFRVARFRGRTPIFEALDHPGLVCRLRLKTIEAAAIAEPAISTPATEGA